MEKALLKAIESAPAALITLGIIFLIVYLLREYRKIRAETDELVKNLVNAKLGEYMTNIQAEVSKIERLVAAQEPKLEKVEGNYLSFLADVEDKTQQIDGLYFEANSKLAALKEAIPNVDEYSARDIIAIAGSMDSSQSKAELCTKVLTHPDAISKDLEAAGDLMEKSSRFTLALKLYEAAVERDPERITVFCEFMSLQAVIVPSKRDESLARARGRVIKQPDKNGFATIANALTELDRYSELREFSQSFIEALNNKDPKLKALALRSVAVSHKELGEVEEAIKFFDQAFQISPEDPNILKPFLGILEEQGKTDEYLATAYKLILADPSEVQYYRIYISALVKAGKYSEAIEYVRRARELPMDQTDEVQLQSYELKAKQANANKRMQTDAAEPRR